MNNKANVTLSEQYSKIQSQIVETDAIGEVWVMINIYDHFREYKITFENR